MTTTTSADPLGRFPGSDGHLDGAPLAYLAVLCVAVAAYLLYCAYQGRRGALAPNPLFGVRTEYARSGTSAWYAVQRWAAPWLAVSAAVVLLTALGVVLARFPGGQPLILTLGTVLAVASVVVGVVRATRRARREVPEADDRDHA